MYSVLEKTKQKTVVPALKLSAPPVEKESYNEPTQNERQPNTTHLTVDADRSCPLAFARIDTVFPSSGFLVLESEIPKATVDEVALAPAAVVKKESKFLGLSQGQLTVGAFGMALVDMFLRDPSLSGIGFLTGAMALAYPKLKKIKRGKWAIHVATLAGVASTGAMAMNLYTPPANALFFSKAQTFFNTTFGTQSAGAITVIFNVFRAAYVAYLIYSAIGIWTAYNRDEDWMSVAKAPIVIFIGGTLIDIVTSVITA